MILTLSFISSSRQVTNFAVPRTLGCNNPFLIFYCDTKGTVNGLQLRKSVICKCNLIVRWDMIREVPVLDSAVICRVTLLFSRAMRVTCFSQL